MGGRLQGAMSLHSGTMQAKSNAEDGHADPQNGEAISLSILSIVAIVSPEIFLTEGVFYQHHIKDVFELLILGRLVPGKSGNSGWQKLHPDARRRNADRHNSGPEERERNAKNGNVWQKKSGVTH